MPRNDLIQVRSDTAANWASVNPTLAVGEHGFETDTGKFKIGNGSTAWSALLYATDASEITGTTLPANVVSSSLTSVGTLTSLNVAGTATVRAASSQDGVALAGRTGGTASYEVTLRPTTLTADQTLTLPNNTGELVSFTSARGSSFGWTNYTTTITQLGTVTYATYVSRYQQIGKLINWEYAFYITGTGTINNAIRINIPQTAQGSAIYSNFGTMHVYDASTNTHYCGHAFAYSTTQAAMMLDGGNTYFQSIALANGDVISGHILYEAA